MAGKYYAVRKGTTPGIFDNWEECRRSVSGYSCAEYKSFKTREEAEAFLKGQSTVFSTDEERKEQTEDGYVPIYVDGSYNSVTEEFSYGMVVLLNSREETFHRKFEDKELAPMRNVAGEIKGAEAAMQYAIDNGIEKIAIYHDYEGIAKWCTGAWKANKEGTKAYRAFYEEAVKKVSVRFVKVTGHSGDKYNDMADAQAKEALGLE